jgi:NADH:ubiquinone oxidoreductase subunit 5 (subunit L)/multisubunit Na+/H+ antiporter MnhA subunit
MIIGLGSGFWGHSIFILSKNISFLEAEYLPYSIKLIPFLFSHFGVFVAYHTSFVLSGDTYSMLNTSNPTNRAKLSFQKHIVFYDFFMSKPIFIKVYTYFNQKWHFDDLYNRFIVQKCINFGYDISFRLLDNGWVAYLGPYGIAKVVQTFSKEFGKLQSGFVYHYAFIILTAMTLLLGAILFLFSLNSGISDIFLPFFESSDNSNALYFVLLLTFWYLSTKASL